MFFITRLQNEGGLFMKEMCVSINEARFLLSNLRTIWANYDFDEKSREYDRRVPDIFICDDDVEVMLNEVHYLPNQRVRYVREYQVKYHEKVYVFEISVHIIEDIVHRFSLNVYTPAGDGVGGLVKLISQSL